MFKTCIPSARSRGSLRWVLERGIKALVLVLLMSGPAASQAPRAQVQEVLAELERLVGASVSATVSEETGLVTFLAFPPGRGPSVKLLWTEPAELRAREFLESYGRAFGIPGLESTEVARVSGPDEVGMDHVRVRQTHAGIPVTGGELIVHLEGSAVVAVNALTLPDLEHLDTTPTVSTESAKDAVLDLLHRKLGVEYAEPSEPKLELLNRGLLEGRRGWTRLAWFIEASAIDLREFIWVDANSGAVLLHFSQLPSGRDRAIHDAQDPSDGLYGVLPGPLVRSEGESPTGDSDADAAYEYSGDTYDYFWTEHGRDSYDGAGATLRSTVHYCPASTDCPYANAFWNGAQMVYGEGYAQADDVDAHEMTHAVTEYTANLFYYMQSGALNESFSDIFGEVVDLTNSSGTDTAGVRWLVGEDLPGAVPIRDMLNPLSLGDPGKMSDAAFWCGDDYRSDRGGVHTNSGIPNHAFALMVDGGSYNGESVVGIGLTRAGKIQYRTLAYYLTSASDFLDNYNSLLQACEDLVGTAGITTSHCAEVQDALDAVEMSANWPCAPVQGQVPGLCPSSQAPDLWHYWDVESSGLTICPSNAVLDSWCQNAPSSLLGLFATSGTRSYWGYNRPTAGSMWVSVNPGASGLPEDARMQFNHAHGFENSGASFYDGGVVEYSTNQGATWNDGGPLIVAGQDYGGTLSTCCLNPLGGRGAFVADSWGYTATQLDLTSLGGESFLYRFNLGTDFTIDEYGWFVDDIRIFTCADCVTTRVLTSAYNGLAPQYSASTSIEAGAGFSVGAMETVTLRAPTVSLSSGFQATGELTIENAACSPD